MELTLPGNTPFSIIGKGNILVITGWRGVGKTTYCQQAVNEFRQVGLKVAGLLSPGRFERQQKNGFFALDLDSLEVRLAASSIPGEVDGIHLGPWVFDPTVLEWGNGCLRQADGAQVVVVDELGPLEFKLQAGWQASFELLGRKNYQLALIVIRPECIEAFAGRGFSFQVREITCPWRVSAIRTAK